MSKLPKRARDTGVDQQHPMETDPALSRPKLRARILGSLRSQGFSFYSAKEMILFFRTAQLARRALLDLYHFE